MIDLLLTLLLVTGPVAQSSHCLPLIQETVSTGNSLPIVQRLNRVEIFYPLGCNTGRVMTLRLLSSRGGVIPIVGYFRISPGYPTRWSVWTYPGYKVQMKISSQWRTIWEDKSP